jgi:RHS repeat-associated protein
MTYDAFGRRVRKEVIGPMRPASPDALPEPPARRVVDYIWDGSCLAAEIDDTRGTRVFVHQPGTLVPLLQQEGEAIDAVVTNPLGMPTELVDQRGEVIWSGRASAWGIVKECTTSERGAAPPFRLLGQYHDEDVGLCYVRHRWFDPEVARFSSPDPLELFGGMNLFGFNGNPTTHADPLGLACILIGDPRIDPAIEYVIKHYQKIALPAAFDGQSPYEVYVHGQPTSFDMLTGPGAWSPMGVGVVVQRIRDAGNYEGGTILLNSCNTGRQSSGTAREVSMAFGTRVYAPNERVWGKAQYIAPAGQVDPNFADPDPSKAGQWNRWDDGVADPGNVYR